MSKSRASKGWVGSRRKRWCIYFRDGLSCVYCGASIESGTSFSLDHIVPWTNGGTRDYSNLVTCCVPCNNHRKIRPLKNFIRTVSKCMNNGITANSIHSHVNQCLYRDASKYLKYIRRVLEQIKDKNDIADYFRKNINQFFHIIQHNRHVELLELTNGKGIFTK